MDLLSFDGRINRTKVWYALYAGIIACMVRLAVLVFWVLILDAIFGTSVESVHLNFYDIFDDPPSSPFRGRINRAKIRFAVSIWFASSDRQSELEFVPYSASARSSPPAGPHVKRRHD